ncbi:MAG: hypothetical protein ABII07_00880 [Patescibacteria group bacterium]|nr:hypothetical protein [Patescibacteria group bacterium]
MIESTGNARVAYFGGMHARSNAEALDPDIPVFDLCSLGGLRRENPGTIILDILSFNSRFHDEIEDLCKVWKDSGKKVVSPEEFAAMIEKSQSRALRAVSLA